MGMIGGFVGSSITNLGRSVATPRYRQLEPWLTTIAVAVACGLLLEITRLQEAVGYFALFTIWQAAVIIFINRGLAFVEEVREP
jgi:hypothetical protein